MFDGPQNLSEGNVNYPMGDPYGFSAQYAPLPSAMAVVSDTSLSPLQKTLALQSIRLASEKANNRGLFSTEDLVHGFVGAGLGYAAATVTGKVLGSVFGLSQDHQSQLANIGAIGGLLKSTGIWR